MAAPTSEPVSESVSETIVAQVVGRDDDGFEAARVDRIFNRRLTDRRPAAVLRPTCAQDVVDGVRLARERGWQVAVRSGGHSWAQWSVRDDALVLDLDLLRDLDYDADTGVVSAGPAVRGGAELAPYLEARGRLFPGGHCPTVGIGGFLLQGGQGWNARNWGWAAEWIEAVDVVTAAGELVRADATHHPDLFWAARGAGPGFPGVVVRFHLRTRPYPRHLAETVQVYELGEYDEVMTWLHGVQAQIGPSVETVALTKTDPLLSPEPVLVVTGLALADDAAEAERDLAPYLTCPARPRALHEHHAEPTTLEAQRARQLQDNPEGHRWVVDNAWLTGSAAEVVDAARTAFTTLPTPQAFTIWFSMAPLRDLPDMAFSLQSETYLAAYVVWPDPADDERCVAWVQQAMADLQPVTLGQYLGDSDLSRRQVRFVSDEAWPLLQQVIADRDPDGLFVGYLAGPDGAANRNHWE